MAKTTSESRRERLATALRANLKRRKAGTRAAAAGKAEADKQASAADEETGHAGEAFSPSHKPR